MRRLLPLALLCVLLGATMMGCSRTEEQKRAEFHLKQLNDPDVGCYHVAIDRLVAMKRDAVVPCIKALRSRKVETRCGAAEALGRIGDRAAVKPLIGRLNDRGGFTVMRGSSPLDRIAVNYNAAIALGRLGDPRAVKPLLKRLRDRDPDMREYVAGTLGEFDDRAAVEPLVEAMRDRNFAVRHNASWALYALTGFNLSEEEYEPWRRWYEGAREAGFH